MKNILFSYVLLSLLFTSCGSTETTSLINVVSIDPTKTEPINKVFASVKVVSLEQKEGALFGTLFNKIRFHNNKIYIVPTSYDLRKILVYDLDGHLIKKVDNFGPGPDQLKRVISLEIIDDDHIEVLSAEAHRIFRYNLQNDSIEWSRKYLGNSPRQFLKMKSEEGYYFARGVTEADYLDPLFWLHSVDNELQESKEYFRGKTMRPNAGRMPLLKHTMQWLDDELRFLPPYSDTIYTLMDDQITPEYKLDFGKYKKYNSHDVDGKKVDDVFYNKNGVRAINFYEGENRLTLNYFFRKGLLTVFDKNEKTRRTVEISKSLLLDNSFVLTPVYADDNMVVCAFRSNNLTAKEYAQLYFEADQIKGDVKALETEEEVPEIVIFNYQ